MGDKLIGVMRFLNGVVLLLLAVSAMREAAQLAVVESGSLSLVLSELGQQIGLPDLGFGHRRARLSLLQRERDLLFCTA